MCVCVCTLESSSWFWADKVSNAFFFVSSVSDFAQLWPVWVRTFFFKLSQASLYVFLSPSITPAFLSRPTSSSSTHFFHFPDNWIDGERGAWLLIVLCSRVKHRHCTSSRCRPFIFLHLSHFLFSSVLIYTVTSSFSSMFLLFTLSRSLCSSWLLIPFASCLQTPPAAAYLLSVYSSSHMGAITHLSFLPTSFLFSYSWTALIFPCTIIQSLSLHHGSISHSSRSHTPHLSFPPSIFISPFSATKSCVLVFSVEKQMVANCTSKLCSHTVYSVHTHTVYAVMYSDPFTRMWACVDACPRWHRLWYLHKCTTQW